MMQMDPTTYNPIARARCLLVLLAILSLTSCSTVPQMHSAALRPMYLYTVNSPVVTISGYRIDPATGALNPVPGSPFYTGDVHDITINPTSTFAYVQASGKILVYRINAATGALTPVPGNPFGTGHQASRIAITPSGSFAYVASGFSDTVSAYRIDTATGALIPVPGSPFPVAPGPFAVTIDPAGSFIYVPSRKAITILSIDATTGALSQDYATGITIPSTKHESVLVNVLDRVRGRIKITPDGAFAYAVGLNKAGQWAILAYRVNIATGVLTPVPGSPFAVGSDPSHFSLNSAGTVAYVETRSGFSVYRVNATTGELVPVQINAPQSEVGSTSLKFTPNGKFAYQTSDGIYSVLAFRVDPTTEALTLLPGSPGAAGTNPASLAIAQP